jgi:hypothetical protein
MKWWHRWRARVWEMRYITILGKLDCLISPFGADFLVKEDYYDLVRERHHAARMVALHRDKAGLERA